MKKLISILFLLWQVQGVQADHYQLTVGRETVQVIPFKDYFYAAYEQSGPIELSLTATGEIRNFEISPKNRQVKATLQDNRLNFKLEKPGYYLVRINEKDKIFIFADPPESAPEENVLNILSYGADNSGKSDVTSIIHKALNDASRTGKTLIFPKGIYLCKMVQLKSNTHIWLEKEAVLLANPGDVSWYQSDDQVKTKKFIYFKDVRNVSIRGKGAINGNGRQLRNTFGDKARIRLLMAVNSTGITVEGILLQDPGSWNTQILACQDVVFRQVKIMNDIQLSNTDGIDPDATRNMLVENCFGYCGDDNIAIKTTNYSGYLQDADSITVRGCVFLTQKSALKVGTETLGTEMRNITFEDNDVIECDRGMALYSSDGAVFKNIRYLNNRFERNLPNAKQAGIHFVATKRKPESQLGKMENILIRNCTFEKPFPKSSEIKYQGESNGISVVIDHLKIAGKEIHNCTEGNIKVFHSDVRFQ